MTTPGLKRRQGGATLIEVLVSLTLVAVTMLGLLGLQLRSMGFQKDSLDRRTAALIAADFSERVAANFPGFSNSGFAARVFAPGAVVDAVPGCVNAAACTDAEVAERDWWHLTREVSRRLPGGAVYLNTNLLGGAGTFVDNVQIVVAWSDPRRADNPIPVAANACALPFVAIVDPTYQCYMAAIYP